MVKDEIYSLIILKRRPIIFCSVLVYEKFINVTDVHEIASFYGKVGFKCDKKCQ